MKRHFTFHTDHCLNVQCRLSYALAGVHRLVDLGCRSVFLTLRWLLNSRSPQDLALARRLANLFSLTFFLASPNPQHQTLRPSPQHLLLSFLFFWFFFRSAACTQVHLATVIDRL